MSSPQKIGLLKRAWSEIPEIVGSTFMGFIGLGLGVAGVINYYQKDGDNRKHKMSYTVYRNDDPRVETLKKD